MLEKVISDGTETMVDRPSLASLCENLPAIPSVGAQTAQLEWLDRAAWDALAAGFDDVRQEHISSFAAAKWGSGRLEYVAVNQNGTFIGGAIVIVAVVPGLKRGVAVVKWGPLWRRCGRTPDLNNLKLAVKLFHQEYVERRGLFLSVHPQADPDHHEAIIDQLKILGFKSGSGLPHPERYLVNTGISSDDLLASLDQKWRYNLKKSRKADLTIDWATGREGLANFMHLYEQMLDRKKFHDASAITTLTDLIQCDVEALRPAIVMVEHEGTPTAGAVIDVSGDCAVYLYGATDNRALPSRAGYAMHWWIAEWLCQNDQIKWYDLGGSEGDHGLHQFKKGFVGKQGVILDTPNSQDACSSFVGTAVGRSIYAARSLKDTISRKLHRSPASSGR